MFGIHFEDLVVDSFNILRNDCLQNLKLFIGVLTQDFILSNTLNTV